MKWYTFSVLILVQSISTAAYCVAWPYVNNPRIVSCSRTPESGECSNNVVYASDGVVFADILPVGRPDPALGTKIYALGIHCSRGNSLTNEPFRLCRWHRPYPRHFPTITGKCELKDTSSWELTPDSTCDTGDWQVHTGAGPGGECVVFTQVMLNTIDPINTPFGWLVSETVANSGNRFCQKALPPTVRCDLDLPSVIDHRTMPPQGTNSVTVVGSIACGAKPVVDVVGGDVVVLGAGVKSRLSTNVTSATSVALTSKLTVNNAAPGEYRGAAVVRVSPY